MICLEKDSGGFAYEEVWVISELARSRKPDEAVVRIQAADTVEPPVFYVDLDFVEPKALPEDFSFVQGKVKSVLVETQNGTAIVEVPGEPVSYGPKVFISNDLLTD